MDIEEVTKWLKIMKANLYSFPEVGSGKKIEALAEAIRLLKNEQSENPTGSTTKNDLGVDCIDRQTAITFVCKNTKEILKDTMPLEVKLSDYYLYENVAKNMRNPKVLPSVTPTCKKGKWLGEKRYPVCPKCNCNIIEEYISCSDYAEMYKPMKFCPNCGADMRGEK